MDGLAFPKPTKSKRANKSRLGQKDKTKARKRLYRLLVRPAYMAGLAAGQGRRHKAPTCERCMSRPGLHIHHMAGRDGELVIDYKKMVAVCPDCHRWIHAHPEAAMRQGWLLSRHRSDEDHEEQEGQPEASPP